MPHIPYSPSLEGPTDGEVAAAISVLAARDAAVKEQKRNTVIFCKGDEVGYITNTHKACGSAFLLKHATVVQTMFYVEPYSCISGDYWKDDELRIVCPHCGRELRLFKSPDLAKIAKDGAKEVVIRKGK